MENTINDTPSIPQQVRASVNERMFFKTMQHLFSSSFSVMGELIQNARRASAKRIDVSLDCENRTVCVTDDGIGIENFDALLDLATSGWTSEEVQLSDKPFGMGFFSSFYACDRVVVYSRGRRLQASRDDIVENRAIDLVEDDIHRNLTRIELHGVNTQLLAKSKDDSYGRTPEGLFTNRLQALVAGFPVPVFLNGDELPRPVARDALAGEMTSIGFVSIAGVHRPGNISIAPHTLIRRLWLQGLPIEQDPHLYGNYQSMPLPDSIIHLDSASFQARMPDRSHLYDSGKQIDRIEQEVKAVIRSHIVREKSRLDPAEFTRKYWDLAAAYGVSSLFTDVPYVPTHALTYCARAVVSTNYQDTMETYTGNDEVQTKTGLVSRQDILDSKVLIWRDAPTCVQDDPWAATAMKIMQREGILRPSGLSGDHWIKEITPSYNDLVFEVESDASSERSVNFCWQNSSANIRLASEVRVRISSSVDETMQQVIAIANDWLLVPLPDSEEVVCDFDYDCWLVGNPYSGDHPVNALATFYGDGDDYREEWESEAINAWDDRVGALRQDHLADTVGRTLSDTPHIGDEQLGDCVLVSVQRYGPAVDDPNRYFRRLRVEAVDNDLVGRLCAGLGEYAGVTVTPEDMARALSAAIRPGAVDNREDDHLQIRLETPGKG